MEIGPIFRALRRNRARFVLIVAEVALTLAIAANALTLILEAKAEMNRPSGFDEENLLFVDSRPFAEELRDPERLSQLRRDDLAALAALPGVKAASNTNFLPWRGGGMSTGVNLAGAPPDAPATGTQFYFADASWIDALGVEIVAGRNFDPADVDANRPDMPFEQAQGGVLISRGLAEELFPAEGAGSVESAVGRELQGTTERSRVIGVFDPFLNPFGGSQDDRAILYPMPTQSFDRGVSYLVRAEPGQAGAVAAGVESALLRIDGGRNLRVRTIPEIRSRFHDRDRMLVASLNAVVVLLIAITALGIVGITSFSVAERTRQIGTRRALGATPVDVVRYFLLENWIVTTIGLALGVGLAYGLNFGLVSWMEASRLDAQVLLPGVAFLWALGLLAALGPALRGSRVAPAIATRNV